MLERKPVKGPLPPMTEESRRQIEARLEQLRAEVASAMAYASEAARARRAVVRGVKTAMLLAFVTVTVVVVLALTGCMNGA